MSTLDDYTDEFANSHVINPDRTRGTDAPPLIDEGHTASGDRLLSITSAGIRHYFAERNSTTLELRSMERAADGRGLPTAVVAQTTCMDVPARVRQTLKLHGYHMQRRGSLVSEVM